MSQNRAALAASVVLMFFAQALAAQFASVKVYPNRGNYYGSCPVTVVFTGVINFTMPHPRGGFVFNYQWTRSDGAKGPITVIQPGPRQRQMFLRDPWTLGGRGQRYNNLSETLHVNSGNTHIVQTSRAVSITCRR